MTGFELHRLALVTEATALPKIATFLPRANLINKFHGRVIILLRNKALRLDDAKSRD